MTLPVTAGVDGSPESLAAARWAAAEAVRREAPLRLVLAWPWLFNAPPRVHDDTGRAEEMLDEAANGLRTGYPGLEVTTRRVAEHPAEVLVAAAGESGLLALGSRGLGAVAGFLIGSVSLQVLARASCPVVLVREGGDEGQEGLGIVVGVELERPHEEVLEFAFEAAARRSCTLCAVHAWNLPATYGYAAVPFGEGLVNTLEEQARGSLAAALRPWQEKYPQVEVVQRVELGSAGQLLADASAQAGLLVVGRRVRSSPVGMHVGPVAHAVLHHARCPVAVVPHR
ncbi:universal stress protein [Peterkaempfera griseoplana]|uniref:universal stress protein n=1 Tax=Peterkaempfera griseoplana TaxID=66896 RepID=UPI0006E3043E|nr:universal stress protein [Peterkaempfera griseoplana]